MQHFQNFFWHLTIFGFAFIISIWNLSQKNNALEILINREVALSILFYYFFPLFFFF